MFSDDHDSELSYRLIGLMLSHSLKQLDKLDDFPCTICLEVYHILTKETISAIHT